MSRRTNLLSKVPNHNEPGVPESFKVLIKELQSLALDIKVLNENHEEIGIRELIEDERDEFDENAEKKKHYSGEDVHFDDKEFDISHNLFDEELDDDDEEGGDKADIWTTNSTSTTCLQSDDLVIDDKTDDDLPDDLFDDDDKSDDEL